MKKISIFYSQIGFLILSFCFCQNIKAQNVFSLSEFNQKEPNQLKIKKIPNINFKKYKSINNKFDYNLSAIDTASTDTDSSDGQQPKQKIKKKKPTLKQRISAMNLDYIKFAQKHYRGVYDDIDENYDELTKYYVDVATKFKKDSAAKADKDFKKSIKTILASTSSSLKQSKTYKDSLMMQLGSQTILDSINENEKIVLNIQSRFDTIQDNLDFVDGKLNSERSKSQSAIETLPTLLATSAFFVPTINLIGDYVNRDNGLAVNIQIFKGGNGADSIPYNNLKRLLVPQASSFGISIGINKSLGLDSDKFNKKHGLSIFSNLHILFKDMPNYGKPKETSPINTAMLQGTFGVEASPIAGLNNVLNFYGGWNYIWLMNQRDNLNKYFGTEKHDFINYFNVGIKLLVPLTSESTNNIFIDLNLVLLNDNLRRLYNTSDGAIPIIAIGLKRNIVNL